MTQEMTQQAEARWLEKVRAIREGPLPARYANLPDDPNDDDPQQRCDRQILDIIKYGHARQL